MTFFDKPASFADDTKKISAFMTQTLKPLGYKKRRNCFNRALGNGLIHQISIFSVGAYSCDHGKFYIHAGCYIPQAELYRKNVVEPKWVPDYLCAIRGCFPKDMLSIRKVTSDLDLISPHLEMALDALARVHQYDHITSSTSMERNNLSLEPLFFDTPQPIVKACIQFERGDAAEAAGTVKQYLAALNAPAAPHIGHIEVVTKWAEDLALI